MCLCECVCACVYAFRIVPRDKIACFKNTSIIIIYYYMCVNGVG